MTTTLAAHPSGLGTELAHRGGSGLDVTLYWNQPTDRVTVVVHDHQAGHRFELSVDRAGRLRVQPPLRLRRQPGRPARRGERPAGHHLGSRDGHRPGRLQCCGRADQPAPPITPADAQ
jgi:hypothetical protein